VDGVWAATAVEVVGALAVEVGRSPFTGGTAPGGSYRPNLALSAPQCL
jgi:hypothetical protein